MRRYLWHLCQMFVHISIILTYGIFGSAFVKVPQDLQWILALACPFVQDLSTKLLTKANNKTVGNGPYEIGSIKFLIQHYIVTKHTVFLAVIVGGVSTPATSACIMAIDFFRTTRAGWKLIQKHKNGLDVEGMKYKFLQNIFKECHVLTSRSCNETRIG